MSLSNDDLIKHRSRIYRGYRAPMAVSMFEAKEEIQSITRDVNGNIEQIIHRVTYPDGLRGTRTENFTIVNDNITGSTVTYTYEDIIP